VSGGTARPCRAFSKQIRVESVEIEWNNRRKGPVGFDTCQAQNMKMMTVAEIVPGVIALIVGVLVGIVQGRKEIIVGRRNGGGCGQQHDAGVDVRRPVNVRLHRRVTWANREIVAPSDGAPSQSSAGGRGLAARSRQNPSDIRRCAAAIPTRGREQQVRRHSRRLARIATVKCQVSSMSSRSAHIQYAEETGFRVQQVFGSPRSGNV
jgi:hypothetical protein